jgi:hypothetical protein
LGSRRVGGTGSARTEAHRRRDDSGEVVPVAGMPEGSEGTAEKLLLGNMVLLVPLVGAERHCGGVSTMRPSGGRTEARRRCGGWCYDAEKRNWMG